MVPVVSAICPSGADGFMQREACDGFLLWRNGYNPDDRTAAAIPAKMTANSLNMMAVEYDRQLFHGRASKKIPTSRPRSTTLIQRSLVWSAVAEDADADTFHLTPSALMTRVISVLGKAGKTGSLYKSLKAISDRVSTRVIVVRCRGWTGEGNPTQSQLIIGGTKADGSYTGMFAF